MFEYFIAGVSSGFILWVIFSLMGYGFVQLLKLFDIK